MPINFFDTKITAVEGAEEDYLPLIEGDTRQILSQVDEFVRKSLDVELKKSNIIFWLTHLIRYGIKSKNPDVIRKATESILLLDKNHSEILIAMLGTTISSGKSKDLTILFLWINDFYLATFDHRNSLYIEQINMIILSLLEKRQRSLLDRFIQPMIAGSSEAGKSALFNLSLAVLQAIKEPFSPDSAKLIAQLFSAVSVHLGSVGHDFMVQRISTGTFTGKSIIYVFACCLKEAARTNRDVVLLICELFRQISSTHHRELNRELGSFIEAGPYKGLSPLHIILHSLISAAYIDNNTTIVEAITSIIQAICQSEKFSSIQALFDIPITDGLNKGKTGRDLLEIARDKSSFSKIPTGALDVLIGMSAPLAHCDDSPKDSILSFTKC